MSRLHGITLVEIMIVLAIIAIISIIALPNYQDYVRRSRYTDAMIALQHVASKQEQFYFDNNRYSANLTSIGMQGSSPDGYYTLTLTSRSTAQFTARASPAAGSGQAGTGRFEIHSSGLKTWDPGEDGTFECSWNAAGRAGTGC